MARESKKARDERRFGRGRVIDIVMGGEWRYPYWFSPTDSEMEDLRNWRDTMRGKAATAKIVAADNVCEFLYANNPKEEWHPEKDFPCCAPPASTIFIEMTRPSRILSGDSVISPDRLPEMWGWLFQFADRNEYLQMACNGDWKKEAIRNLEDNLSTLYKIIDMPSVERAMAMPAGEADQSLGDAEKQFIALGMAYKAIQGNIDFNSVVTESMQWSAYATLLARQGNMICPLASSFLMMSKTGQLVQRPEFEIFGGSRCADMSLMGGARDSANSMLFPALLTLSFMHCKNIVHEEVEPDRQINRERRRAGLRPFVRYHTINIEPMKRVLKTEGNIETEGLKRALHICRGHFATYTDTFLGRQLSEPITIWKPAHVRGSAKQGVVISDYNVKSPKPEPGPTA